MINICKQVGLKPNEEFMLDLPVFNYSKYTFYFDENGRLKSNSNLFNLDKLLCLILKCPEMILKKEKLDATETAICRLLNAKWITSNEADNRYVELWQGNLAPYKDYTNCYKGKDYVATISHKFFPHVRQGSCMVTMEAKEIE